MGLKDLFNFKAANKTVEAAKNDVKRPRKDEVAAKRQQKNGGKK